MPKLLRAASSHVTLIAVCVLGVPINQLPAQIASPAVDAIRRGDLATGLSKLQSAIGIRRRLEGIGIQEKADTPSDAAMAHGREQFDQLAVDRPVIVEHADKPGFDRLREWAVRRFAGARLGSLVDWDKVSSVGYIAEHSSPNEGVHGTIRIAEVYPSGPEMGQPLPFEVVWRSLVFELLNIANTDRFNRIDSAAYRGELSRAEFVAELFYIEFDAVQQIQQFYVDYYLPWAISAKITSNPDLWYITEQGWWKSPEEALDRYHFSSDYPWGYYGELFDEIRKSPNAQPRKPSRIHHASCIEGARESARYTRQN